MHRTELELMMARRHPKQRVLIGSWAALVVAAVTFTAGTTFGLFGNSEAQGANTFAGATFSPSTAPTPTAVNQTPGSNSVLLTWTPVTLSDTSNSGTIKYTVLRSDSTTACSLVTTTSCTDTTGTGGANYTYTVTVFYVVSPTSTWSLGPGAASTQVTFPETPSFTTTLVQPAQSTVGNSWSDYATVTGDANGGAPTGPVTFTFCQESLPNTPCTGGTTVATLSAPTSTAGDVSTYTPSDAQTPTVGTYCFNAAYGATTGGPYSSVAQQTDNECFTVSPATPSSFVTNLTQPTHTTLGNSWNDAAVVTGNATGGAPTGSVTFTFCTESVVNTPCTGGATIDTISSPTIVLDASTFTLPVGDAQRPTTTGTYCYNASYTPTTGGNYTSVAQQSDNECFTVTPATPSNVVTDNATSTFGQSVTFTATVTGPAGVTQPTGGTVTWTVSGTAGITSCTTSSTTTLDGTGKATCVLTTTNAGTYLVSDSWAGDSNYTLATSSNDTVTVAKASPTLTVAAPGTGTAGTTIPASSITATLAASSGANATATITFTVFGPQSGFPTTCTGGTPAGTATPAGNGTYATSTSFTPTRAGTYWWYVSSPTDSNNNAANSLCNSSSMTATVVVKASPTLLVAAPPGGSVGTAIPSANITATLASSSGATDTTTISFRVFGPQASAPLTCTSGGAAAGTATPAGNGTYATSASFTPGSVGTYWWYVSSPTDANNNAVNSLCNSGSMTHTVVTTAVTPSVYYATPAALLQGATSQSITITGANFVAGLNLNVTVTGTAGITTSSPSVTSATTITVNVTVPVGQAIGNAYGITVTNGPGGTASCVNCFAVNNSLSTPSVAMTFPVNGASYAVNNNGVNSWTTKSEAACFSVTGQVCGTASDVGGSISSVSVSVIQESNNLCWSAGTTFTTACDNFVAVTTGTSTWALNFAEANMVPTRPNTYVVIVRMVDSMGNTAYAVSTFTSS